MIQKIKTKDSEDQKDDVPLRLKRESLKRHSPFGCSRNDCTLKDAFFCQVPRHNKKRVEKVLITRSKLIHKNFLPDALISELEEFAKRNSIFSVTDMINENKSILHCCPRCLKAHAIKRAKGLKLNKESVNYLEKIFNCETGHMGYYIDEELLVKI